MHLGQPGFTHSACRLLTKNKERIKKIKLLDKACFQHDMENMIIINMELVQWFTNFDKNHLMELLNIKLLLIKN